MPCIAKVDDGILTAASVPPSSKIECRHVGGAMRACPTLSLQVLGQWMSQFFENCCKTPQSIIWSTTVLEINSHNLELVATLLHYWWIADTVQYVAEIFYLMRILLSPLVRQEVISSIYTPIDREEINFFEYFFNAKFEVNCLFQALTGYHITIRNLPGRKAIWRLTALTKDWHKPVSDIID